MKPSRSFLDRAQDVFLGVVAPCRDAVPRSFVNPCPDHEFYETVIADIERFRGAVYLEEGAIRPEALDDGARHQTVCDYESWHLFLLNRQLAVCGCVRLTPCRGAARSADLRVYDCIRRMDPVTAARYGSGLDALLDRARRARLPVWEVGGWAVAKELRQTPVALLLAAACWPLGQLLGPAWAVATATCRNRSADMLRRLGGAALTDGAALPPFFDPYFRCDMEILTFDSQIPSPEYSANFGDLQGVLSAALVVTP
jgi:hypothetical protein